MSNVKLEPNKIYAVVNQKGGAGKSTTAGHLAYWLSQQCSVVFVDADGQQSPSSLDAGAWIQNFAIKQSRATI